MKEPAAQSPEATPPSAAPPHIEVRGLTMAYGSFVVMRDLNFTIERGRITAIMGGSGCGKSTLLKHMIGLKAPAAGDILYHGESFAQASPARQQQMVRAFGVTYQQGALWSSMTLAENIGLPLTQYTDLNEKEIRELATLKLSLVGLRGFEDHFPSEISGGMRKRAALARAIALDPEILFFDEPSAGLDPISSKRLDDLILQIRDSLQATVIIVTHELPSLFSIVDTGVFLDVEARTMTALGNPREMSRNPPNANVAYFLSRGGSESPA